MAIVFSQLRLSFNAPLRQMFSTQEPLGSRFTALLGIGLALITLGLALRWLS
ncbi:MAG: hypothetical protein MUC68_13475 [Burkholderiaceae bacterium]|nr:hypothetical protein [Burkholderiaceae bacterium]